MVERKRTLRVAKSIFSENGLYMTILENPKRSKMHPGGHLQPFRVENRNYGLSIYLSVMVNNIKQGSYLRLK